MPPSCRTRSGLSGAEIVFVEPSSGTPAFSENGGARAPLDGRFCISRRIFGRLREPAGNFRGCGVGIFRRAANVHGSAFTGSTLTCGAGPQHRSRGPQRTDSRICGNRGEPTDRSGPGTHRGVAAARWLIFPDSGTRCEFAQTGHGLWRAHRSLCQSWGTRAEACSMDRDDLFVAMQPDLRPERPVVRKVPVCCHDLRWQTAFCGPGF